MTQPGPVPPYYSMPSKWARSLMSASVLVGFVAAIMIIPFDVEKGLWLLLGAVWLLFIERRTALLDKRLNAVELQFDRLVMWEQQLATATQHVEATLNHVNGVGMDETQAVLMPDDWQREAPTQKLRPINWTDEVD